MAMMAFALVEVVMIVVGIVMANQLEEQKELREVTEVAEVLFREVLDDLEEDCWEAFGPIWRNRSDNGLADILYNLERSDQDVVENAFSIYFMLRFPAEFDVNTEGYDALVKLHERLPQDLLELYQKLNSLMAKNEEILECNRRYKDIIYANMEHNIKTLPWWNRSTHTGKPEPEAIPWMMSEECLAQTHLVVDVSSQLAGATERFRVGAIDLYDDIKEVIGDTSKSPGYMDYGFLYDSLSLSMLGSYRLSDTTIFDSKGKWDLTLFEDDGLLFASYEGGDTLRLTRSGYRQYAFPGPLIELYFPEEEHIKVAKWTIQKDWVYLKSD